MLLKKKHHCFCKSRIHNKNKTCTSRERDLYKPVTKYLEVTLDTKLQTHPDFNHFDPLFLLKVQYYLVMLMFSHVLFLQLLCMDKI